MFRSSRWTRCATVRMFTSMLFGAVLLLLSAVPVFAQGIQFTEVSASSGLVYERARSATDANAQELKDLGTLNMNDLIGAYPIKARGAPGVALLDFDGDGDLDVYVTNGPNVANSLFSNQLAESSTLTFVDVASAAGAGLVDQDSTGVCFGDVDNDGDEDLYVLGRSEENRLLENQGDGTFADITSSSGGGGGPYSSMACSMGDIDGDGLLDIVVANNFDMARSFAIFTEPFALNEPNELFVNLGGNVFEERGFAAGLQNVREITWAVAMVDLDQDGVLDIVTASDNAGIPFASQGGVDRGFIRFLHNDGTGFFTDETAARGLLSPGDWMGLAFADLDSNGTLDIFGTNTGDYFEPFLGIPALLGDQASRWYLQEADGTFSDPGVGETVAAAFGWGTAAFDYDNDGATDLVYYGGLDAGPIVECSNPGVLLHNDGSAGFSFDSTAFAGSVDHSLRIEHGLAVGDLNGDGFQDIVSVSNHNVSPGLPPGLMPYPFVYGSVFDVQAQFFPSFLPGANPGEIVWSAAEFPNGTLTVEINSGGNGNGWVEVEALGSIGLTTAGGVNRDGIGAVLRVTPWKGKTAIQPVLGGSSYASQHSLKQTFGLGRAKWATVDVLWPGGRRNRLYHVRKGERIVFPEIPCSYDDLSVSFRRYRSCVAEALGELVGSGALNRRAYSRFYVSALVARLTL